MPPRVPKPNARPRRNSLPGMERPQPQVQVAPAAESERLADLLDQRKAILMAILGSAKQSLSNLRR